MNYSWMQLVWQCYLLQHQLPLRHCVPPSNSWKWQVRKCQAPCATRGCGQTSPASCLIPSFFLSPSFAATFPGETRTSVSSLQDRAPTPDQRVERSSLVNQWIYLGYIEGYRWGVSFSKIGVSKTSAHWKNPPQQGRCCLREAASLELLLQLASSSYLACLPAMVL